MKKLTREQKIERILEVALKQVEQMVLEGASSEQIALFNQSQLEVILKIK